MLNPINKILTLLLLTCPMLSIAQDADMAKYLKRGIAVNFRPVNFLTDKRFPEARTPPDSLDIQARTAAELQTMIDAGLHTRIYGVKIEADSAHLEEVLRALKQFPKLKFLVFDGLPLFKRDAKPYPVPAVVTELQTVEGIELAFTAIDRPDALRKFASLKKLQAIALNTITDVPVSNDLLGLKGIRSIKLSGKDINAVDISKVKWEFVDYGGSAPKKDVDGPALLKLSKVKTLKELKISYFELGDDLSVLSKFTQLKKLDIWGSKLKTDVQIFEQLGKLTKLEELSYRHYKDDTQTLNGLERLVNLKSLTIDGLTLLKSIPASVYSLKKLERLTMEGYDFTEVPLGIFQLPELRFLDLSSNKLASLPEGNYTSIKLKTLQLSYNGIKALPNGITQLTGLEHLDAKANKIARVPKGWQQLEQLKGVDLSTNKLTEFPDGLQNLTGLKKLTLSSNYIKSVPDPTGDGYVLKQFEMISNDLETLPEHFGKYKKLEVLNLMGNRLKTLPASLGECQLLRELNMRTWSRMSGYDVDKVGDQRFVHSAPDNTKVNRIASLPEGLKNTPHLELLDLSDNKGINAESVFSVLLAMPRKNFKAVLVGNDLAELPATDKWADMEFSGLELSNNKLTTLPVQFATMKRYSNVDLRHNLFPTDPILTLQTINTAADLKLIYDDMGIIFPGQVSKPELAAALTKHVTDFYYNKKWGKAVEYADEAIGLDTAAYNKHIRWDEIAASRFGMRDYKGAISDYDRYIDKETKTFMHWGPSLTEAEDKKVKAHLALGEKQKAAETHELFAQKLTSKTGLTEAALIYKEIGMDSKHRQLMDTVVAHRKFNLNWHAKRKDRVDIGDILDCAETFIVADKYADAANLINDQDAKLYAGKYLAIKNYLLATANYLLAPDQFPQIKTALTADIKTNGKISGWNFDMFNKWVELTFKDPIKKRQLTDLQTIAK